VHAGLRYVADALSDPVYDYGGDAAVAAAKSIHDFNLEQQVRMGCLVQWLSGAVLLC